jgi:hypothetical protein
MRVGDRELEAGQFALIRIVYTGLYGGSWGGSRFFMSEVPL